MFVARFVTVTVAPGMPARLRIEYRAQDASGLQLRKSGGAGKHTEQRPEQRRARISSSWILLEMLAEGWSLPRCAPRYLDVEPRTRPRFWIVVSRCRRQLHLRQRSLFDLGRFPRCRRGCRRCGSDRAREASRPRRRAPSSAASNTLEWQPHSKSGCDAFPSAMRASRSSSVTRSTWHCSCGHVTHSALEGFRRAKQHAADEHAPTGGSRGTRCRRLKVGFGDERYGVPRCRHSRREESSRRA